MIDVETTTESIVNQYHEAFSSCAPFGGLQDDLVPLVNLAVRTDRVEGGI